MEDVILVVAYDEDLARLLMTVMNLQGCSTIASADGKTALALAVIHQPRLIFLDTPVLDVHAQDLVMWMRLSNVYAPIVLLSTSSDISLMAQEFGVEAYVPKPFDLEEIVACLDLCDAPLERAVAA